MKKLFTLLMALTLVFAIDANAQSRKTWDFRHWSASTIENLRYDLEVNGPNANWRNYESDATKADQQHFWIARKMAGTLVTNNGSENKVIPETEGLVFGASKAKKLVISYNHNNKGENGGSFIWLNGKNETIKVPAVSGGQMLHIAIESHSATQARGVTITFAGQSVSSPTGNFTPIEYTEYDVELPEGEGELLIKSTNGCHIYYIIFGEGDAPKSANVGYLYYDAAGDGFEALPLYTAISDAENYTFTPLNLNNATPTQEELAAYDAVILDGSIPADEAIVKALQPNLYWQPTVNFNPALAQAFGFGEPLTSEIEIGWVNDVKKSWFTGFENWSDNMYAMSNGEVMPTPLKLSAAHATATPYIVATNMECAFPDSVIAYTYNAGHNAYIYYGQSADYGAGTEGILKNVVADAVASKTEVSVCPTPAFKAEYVEMQTTLAITNINKNAVIHYTTDGTEPTLESPVYTEPLVFTTEATVKAIAVADGYTVSEVNSFDVKLYHQAKAPVVYTSGDEATEDATVTIASEEGDNVVIWYNFIGSADTLKSSKYTGPIVLKHAATITAFALGAPGVADNLAKSDLVSADIKANMKKVRRDEVAHFQASGWNTLENLELDGKPQEAWQTSNYFFTWGKSAVMSFENVGEPITDEEGNPIMDENGNFIYNTADKAVSVTKNTADPDWQITSRGQVMVYQGNSLGASVGSFEAYNPERAEDYFENLATTGGIQFGSIASGDKATATIQTTKAYAGPFNVVAIVANANGDKNTGIGKTCTVAVQVSTDSINWETIGEEFTTASIYRCYKKFEASYDNEAPAYVRLASVSGSSQNVHDIYIFNHGEKSIAEEEAYTGVEEVNVAAEQGAVKTAKVLKDGRIVILCGNAVFTTAGARMK